MNLGILCWVDSMAWPELAKEAKEFRSYLTLDPFDISYDLPIR